MLLVPYFPQNRDGACLPACAQMLLAYAGREVSQIQLMRLLGTTEAGTPFSRLHLLSQLGVQVNLQTNGTLAQLCEHLPVIAALHSAWLSGQPAVGQHAVIVVAVDDRGVTVLDPAQNENLVLLTENEFLAAWIEMDCIFAYLSAL